MPASILTTLVLWSALLHPGVSADPARDGSSNSASCRSTMPISVEQTTIQAWPIDESPSWGLSEANSEEEESSDNDDNVIVAERSWMLPRLGLIDSTATIRLDRGFAVSPTRSSILRC